MKQWHPVFAQLLRPAVEAFYDVQTTMPVGDAPREADFVLLRRTTATPPTFRGLWRHLTTWSILEFKGPTVAPRRGDIDLLIELGLGIHRRLQQERRRERLARLPGEEISFWYLANRFGRRFLSDAEATLGELETVGPGLWRGAVLGRLVYLVSSVDLPVEEDSLPLHIVGIEPAVTERAVAQLVLEQPVLQERYGGWLASLHPRAWKEIERMARTLKKKLVFDIRPAIKSLGLDRVIEQVGLGQVIEQVGLDQVIEQVGLDQVIEQVGLDQVIEQVGEKRLIKEMGLDRLLANLSAAEKRELKRRLE